jgi:alpha-methylacyl-CoA racemase
LWSVTAILGALYQRDRTGRGAVLDISMVEASMGFGIAGLGLLFGGQPPRRGDEPLTGGLALYATYRTKDGRYVALGALEPKFWGAFCAGVGLEADASMMTAVFPGPHQAALKAKLAELFGSRTRAEWEAFSQEHDCCLEPVLDPDELRGDAHLTARRAIFEIDSPWGRLEQLRTPVTDPEAPHSPPPRQGEHTDVILREAGYDEAAIAAMRAEGAAR